MFEKQGKLRCAFESGSRKDRQELAWLRPQAKRVCGLARYTTGHREMPLPPLALAVAEGIRLAGRPLVGGSVRSVLRAPVIGALVDAAVIEEERLNCT